MDKSDFLRELLMDETFNKRVKVLLGLPTSESKQKKEILSCSEDEIVISTKLPFKRNLAKEEEIIEKAVSTINFKALAKLIRILPAIDSEEFEWAENNTYQTNPEIVKNSVIESLKNCFEALDKYPIINSFTGDSKGDHTYNYMCEGAFYCESYYYLDNETGEYVPDVIIKYPLFEYSGF